MNEELIAFLKTIIWDGFIIKAGPYFLLLLAFMLVVEIACIAWKNRRQGKNDDEQK